MTRADLVPCPPMHARLSVAACVAIHKRGYQLQCADCALGRERGAGQWTRSEPERNRLGLANWYGPGALGGKTKCNDSSPGQSSSSR